VYALQAMKFMITKYIIDFNAEPMCYKLDLFINAITVDKLYCSTVCSTVIR